MKSVDQNESFKFSVCSKNVLMKSHDKVNQNWNWNQLKSPFSYDGFIDIFVSITLLRDKGF